MLVYGNQGSSHEGRSADSSMPTVGPEIRAAQERYEPIIKEFEEH